MSNVIKHTEVEFFNNSITVPCYEIDGWYEEAEDTREVLFNTVEQKLKEGDLATIESVLCQLQEWCSNEDVYHLLNEL
jgi:hypothetical protein